MVFSNVFLILQTCSVSSSEGRSAFGSNLLTNQSSISATNGKLGCRKFSKKQEDYIGVYFKLGWALNILVQDKGGRGPCYISGSKEGLSRLIRIFFISATALFGKVYRTVFQSKTTTCLQNKGHYLHSKLYL